MATSIVSPETMTLAVSGVEYASVGTWNPEKLCGFNKVVEPVTPTELGHRLYRLNAAAVEERHPDDPGRARIPQDYNRPQDHFAYLREGGALHPDSREPAVAAYKAMCHLRNQCAQGDIPRTDPDYAALCAAMQVLAELIVCSLPEYQSAAIGA